MNKFLIVGLLLFMAHNLVGQDSTNLIRKWRLVKYDVFDKIKKSPAYLLGTDEEIQKFDDLAKLLLDSTTYDFRGDGTMIYSDIENQKIVKREAIWTMKDNILFIVELKRPYKREAKIISLTSSTLVMSPIIDGTVGDSPMTFSATAQ